jgi:hypothetical protein
VARLYVPSNCPIVSGNLPQIPQTACSSAESCRPHYLRLALATKEIVTPLPNPIRLAFLATAYFSLLLGHGKTIILLFRPLQQLSKYLLSSTAGTYTMLCQPGGRNSARSCLVGFKQGRRQPVLQLLHAITDAGKSLSTLMVNRLSYSSLNQTPVL